MILVPSTIGILPIVFSALFPESLLMNLNDLVSALQSNQITGEITLSRSEAVEQGESLAAERDESDEGDDDDEDAYFVDSTSSGWAVIRHDGQYAEFADSPEAEEAAERLNSGLAKESEYYWSEKS